MDTKIVPAYTHPKEITALFSEYTDLLTKNDSAFRDYLAVQHYDEEINHPESKYGMPFGRLYLAYCGGEAAGCIGLRKIDEQNCEMKRLYVRPRSRGQKLGEQLVHNRLLQGQPYAYLDIHETGFVICGIYASFLF